MSWKTEGDLTSISLLSIHQTTLSSIHPSIQPTEQQMGYLTANNLSFSNQQKVKNATEGIEENTGRKTRLNLTQTEGYVV